MNVYVRRIIALLAIVLVIFWIVCWLIEVVVSGFIIGISALIVCFGVIAITEAWDDDGA